MLWLAGEVVNCVLAALLAGLHYPLESSLSTQLSKRAAWQLSAAKGALRSG